MSNVIARSFNFYTIGKMSVGAGAFRFLTCKCGEIYFNGGATIGELRRRGYGSQYYECAFRKVHHSDVVRGAPRLSAGDVGISAKK